MTEVTEGREDSVTPHQQWGCECNIHGIHLSRGDNSYTCNNSDQPELD